MGMEEVRKLARDMNEMEKKELHSRVRSQKKKFVPCGHLLERMGERTITQSMINKALDRYNLIEYHYKHSHRVVLRSRDEFNVNGYSDNVCLIVNLDNNEIVSAYRNGVNYHHADMDEEMHGYKKSLNVVDHIHRNYFGVSDLVS